MYNSGKMTNKEIAKTWFASIDNNDYATIKGLMHSDHKFINPMSPAPAGQDEHIGMMQMMSGAFTGEHKLDLVLEEGNYVVVRARYVSTHTGEFNGMGPTGKPVELSFIDIFEIVDGKVRNEILEMNLMTLLVQIGAMPA
jgi:predicted ester cyclase